MDPWTKSEWTKDLQVTRSPLRPFDEFFEASHFGWPAEKSFVELVDKRLAPNAQLFASNYLVYASVLFAFTLYLHPAVFLKTLLVSGIVALAHLRLSGWSPLAFVFMWLFLMPFTGCFLHVIWILAFMTICLVLHLLFHVPREENAATPEEKKTN
eukprot:TRINITY_DN2943_c0_g2_i1.p3 TRINITY_DN2943_c0_g2~~TRINITY_DN2943_c0_g2_i1.p3  ORF type:complete len:155 (+),score=48.70 TRINITY_DN2943_c0_g2_i1:163-627(+)